MFYCSEQAFYTAWGGKKKKEKQTKSEIATQAKNIQGRI